jgi:hypothetical protein
MNKKIVSFILSISLLSTPILQANMYYHQLFATGLGTALIAGGIRIINSSGGKNKGKKEQQNNNARGLLGLIVTAVGFYGVLKGPSFVRSKHDDKKVFHPFTLSDKYDAKKIKTLRDETATSIEDKKIPQWKKILLQGYDIFLTYAPTEMIPIPEKTQDK